MEKIKIILVFVFLISLMVVSSAYALSPWGPPTLVNIYPTDQSNLDTNPVILQAKVDAPFQDINFQVTFYVGDAPYPDTPVKTIYGLSNNQTASYALPVYSNKTYYWRARAYDGEEYSTYTPTWSFTTGTVTCSSNADCNYAANETCENGYCRTSCAFATGGTYGVCPSLEECDYDLNHVCRRYPCYADSECFTPTEHCADQTFYIEEAPKKIFPGIPFEVTMLSLDHPYTGNIRFAYDDLARFSVDQGTITPHEYFVSGRSKVVLTYDGLENTTIEISVGDGTSVDDVEEFEVGDTSGVLLKETFESENATWVSINHRNDYCYPIMLEEADHGVFKEEIRYQNGTVSIPIDITVWPGLCTVGSGIERGAYLEPYFDIGKYKFSCGVKSTPGTLYQDYFDPSADDCFNENCVEGECCIAKIFQQRDWARAKCEISVIGEKGVEMKVHADASADITDPYPQGLPTWSMGVVRTPDIWLTQDQLNQSKLVVTGVFHELIKNPENSFSIFMKFHCIPYGNDYRYAYLYAPSGATSHIFGYLKGFRGADVIVDQPILNGPFSLEIPIKDLSVFKNLRPIESCGLEYIDFIAEAGNNYYSHPALTPGELYVNIQSYAIYTEDKKLIYCCEECTKPECRLTD